MLLNNPQEDKAEETEILLLAPVGRASPLPTFFVLLLYPFENPMPGSCLPHLQHGKAAPLSSLEGPSLAWGWLYPSPSLLLPFTGTKELRCHEQADENFMVFQGFSATTLCFQISQSILEPPHQK